MSLEKQVQKFFRVRPGTHVHLAELRDALGGYSSGQILNAIYGLRRRDVPVQVVTPRTVFMYEAGAPVKRDFGHGYRGNSLRVLHRGSNRWICVDAEGRAWFAYPVGGAEALDA